MGLLGNINMSNQISITLVSETLCLDAVVGCK